MMLRKLNTSPTLFEAIADDVFASMNEIGQGVVEELRDRLSVPVEYAIGPRGGIHVIRSLPGEPPRKETGELQESVQQSVEADADVYTLEVFSDCPYAPYLENGTARILPRPAWADTAESFADSFADRMVRAVEGK